MSAVRILLADDHTLVRHGLRRMLEERKEWQVVAEARDGREAIELGERCRPDIAIIDVAMPLLNGIETTRQLLRKVHGVRVLVLSMHVDEVYVTQILKAGARGYLLKDSADADLFNAVTAILAGQSFFSPAIAKLMADEFARPRSEGLDRYDALSMREREIFQLIAEARTNKEIASLLGISSSTVETHRAKIIQKLDLHSAAQIALYAVRRGVIR